VSIENWSSYDNGEVLTTQFLTLGAMDEDTFLGANRDVTGGWASGTIVPAPTAFILGLLGLTAVGWRMRRYA